MKLVAYYRVSTERQGQSGLGLEAQVAAVEGYARASGASVLRSYREVESGKRNDRPELQKALADCKRSRARLVIAKLDRLARNVAFTATLMDGTVDFVACDNPHANRLTIHILAAVAEDEARRISERTRAALAALKARGGRLGAARPGGRQLSEADRRKGREQAAVATKALADAAYADLAPTIAELRAEGMPLRGIADRLNDMGHSTRRGLAWNAVQVMRVLRRL
jgi:DNA invertase Pin-like site-specific DNA recombinase